MNICMHSHLNLQPAFIFLWFLYKNVDFFFLNCSCSLLFDCYYLVNSCLSILSVHWLCDDGYVRWKLVSNAKCISVLALMKLDLEILCWQLRLKNCKEISLLFEKKMLLKNCLGEKRVDIIWYKNYTSGIICYRFNMLPHIILEKHRG